MDIHEYQSKEILSEYGIPIPAGGLAYSPEQAAYRATEIGGSLWVVKAQIHSGARGKAGGIKILNNIEELNRSSKEMLGKILGFQFLGVLLHDKHYFYIRGWRDREMDLFA